MKIVVSASGSSALAPRAFPVTQLLILVAAVAVYFVFPDNLSLATYVAIYALFALSLDVALGIAGIVTLGHAVFFGVGAYAAGLIAIAGWHEPITGVLFAGLCAATLAAGLGPFVLRLTGLPLVMVTLAVAVFFSEAATKMTWLTGGDDGLYNIALNPVLGLFNWSIVGRMEYLYVLVWLALMFLAAERLASSPLGLALRGARENRMRMGLLGSSVLRHLLVAYVFSAFIAGIAGALLAQTTQFVGLEVLSVEQSIDVLMMLVLGGVGHLFGALLGAPVYLLVKDLSKQVNPHAWMIVIGFMLIFVMLFARGGIYGAIHAGIDGIRRKRSGQRS